MAFEFNTCKLADGTEVKGLYEIQPKIFGDTRGYFLETYSEKDFFAAGIIRNPYGFNEYSTLIFVPLLIWSIFSCIRRYILFL